MTEEEFSERLLLLREHISQEEMDQIEIDQIVSWQMTGILTKRTPVVKHQEQPRCRRCQEDWHGLPKGKCKGSYDTPDAYK